MARHHHTPAGDVPFTPDEEAEWDAREAADALPNALAAFRRKRDQVVNTGVMHEGNRWHSDPLSQHAMGTAVTLAREYEAAFSQPWSTQWKTLTGYVTVTADALVAAGFAVGAHVQAAFAREDELITLASNDLAAALAAAETGWPENGQ